MTQSTEDVVAIGDIHGCKDLLDRLLNRIGVCRKGLGWIIPSDIHLVFLGDLVDRGEANQAVVDQVRSLVDTGKATCLMGNHELNLVQLMTPVAGAAATFLRPRSEKNLRQVARTLEDFGGFESPALREAVTWMQGLPVALLRSGLRAVHAAWSDEALKSLDQRDDQWFLPEGQWQRSADRNDPLASALEYLCKGPELPLPGAASFLDKDGYRRTHGRIAWWTDDPQTVGELFHLPRTTEEQGFSRSDRIPSTLRPIVTTPAAPVVFGHYWLSGTPGPLHPQRACLDYSAVKGGPLVAYRHPAGWEMIDLRGFMTASR